MAERTVLLVFAAFFVWRLSVRLWGIQELNRDAPERSIRRLRVQAFVVHGGTAALLVLAAAVERVRPVCTALAAALVFSDAAVRVWSTLRSARRQSR